jgi:ribonucleoside-diphosphate reductase alpha chain
LYIKELDREIEAPEGWSYNAVRIFADKYLHHVDGSSIFAAIRRVATGVANGHLELADHLYDGIVEQRFAFNSPVFFNVGIEEQPQCSACFIQSVTDDMDSILNLAVKEGQLFKYGSGTGTNLSPLRGSMEGLAGGGKASGPVSFMRVYDAVAGTVKSGGKTRRAAKMQILDADHPDIREFIWCKAREERKAKDLITKAGYDTSFDGEAYASVFFQNANLSVRVTDKFMDAANYRQPWDLTARTTGETFDSLLASDLLSMVAEAAWECGDPGMQFHDEINRWHTCPHIGAINSSNPCSEYMFLDETACNLASLNLVAYYTDEGGFNTALFVTDVYYLIEAMDNIVSLAGYPTPEIAKNSELYRPLGLGFTNLGHLLAKMGLKYDSAEARAMAASITALMHFSAANASVDLAIERGAHAGFSEHQLRVHRMHMAHLPPESMDVYNPIWASARRQAHQALDGAEKYGFRNAQLTVLAPTGTISFIMDCITTGIEPLFSRKMVKQLAGGGSIELNFDDPHIRTADEVSPSDHLRMMAACQPFLSGAISKTINMPSSATVQDVEDVFIEAWGLDLKAVAIYRDGCKLSQPLSTGATTENLQQHRSARQPLPDVRSAITHRFSVAGHTGYFTVGLYDDGSPGELFVHVAKEGSTISGLLDSWAIGVSIALQHGVPLEALMEKYAYSRFEPAGLTGNPEIPMAHSIVDYIARWLLLRYETGKEFTTMEPQQQPAQSEVNICYECGSIMQRTGTCYSCPTCGANGGCG